MTYASWCTVNLQAMLGAQHVSQLVSVPPTFSIASMHTQSSVYLNPVELRTLPQLALSCEHQSRRSSRQFMPWALPHARICRRWLRIYGRDTFCEKERTAPLPLKRVSYYGLSSLRHDSNDTHVHTHTPSVSVCSVSGYMTTLAGGFPLTLTGRCYHVTTSDRSYSTPTDTNSIQVVTEVNGRSGRRGWCSGGGPDGCRPAPVTL